MTRRICDRIFVGLEGELFLHSSTNTVFIENISEYGLYAKVASDNNTDNHNSHFCINLKHQLLPNKSLRLNCNKIWSFKNTASSLIERIGFQIIDPPDEYRELYHIIVRQPDYHVTTKGQSKVM